MSMMGRAYITAKRRNKIVDEVLARAPAYVRYSSIVNGEINWGRGENDDAPHLEDKGWVKGALKILAQKGFAHPVAGRIEDLDRLLETGRPTKPWTMVVDGLFVFTDDTDAVAFKLVVSP